MKKEENTDLNKELESIGKSWKKVPKETKRSLGSVIIFTLIVGSLVLGALYLFYLRMSRIMTPAELLQIKSAISGLSGWGIFAIIGAVLFYIFGFACVFFFKHKYKSGEMTKDVGSILMRVLICSLAALFVSWDLIKSDGTKSFLWVFVLAFSICYAFFEIFGRMKEKTITKLLTFSFTLLSWFVVPAMVVIILLLGSMNGIYHYQSTFLNDTSASLGYTGVSNSSASTFGWAAYKTVETIYNIGNSRPKFMFWLSICALFVLFFVATLKHFGDKEGENTDEESKKPDEETKNKSKKEWDELGIDDLLSLDSV